VGGVIDPVLARGREWARLDGEDVNMNQQIQAEEERTIATHVETDAALRDQLAQCGYSAEEIVAFLWLRRWYQTGGSDRMELLRHWEFLKWLVRASLLEE
jgi:hypothetical protein